MNYMLLFLASLSTHIYGSLVHDKYVRKYTAANYSRLKKINGYHYDQKRTDVSSKNGLDPTMLASNSTKRQSVDQNDLNDFLQVVKSLTFDQLVKLISTYDPSSLDDETRAGVMRYDDIRKGSKFEQLLNLLTPADTSAAALKEKGTKEEQLKVKKKHFYLSVSKFNNLLESLLNEKDDSTSKNVARQMPATNGIEDDKTNDVSALNNSRNSTVSKMVSDRNERTINEYTLNIQKKTTNEDFDSSKSRTSEDEYHNSTLKEENQDGGKRVVPDSKSQNNLAGFEDLVKLLTSNESLKRLEKTGSVSIDSNLKFTSGEFLTLLKFLISDGFGKGSGNGDSGMSDSDKISLLRHLSSKYTQDRLPDTSNLHSNENNKDGDSFARGDSVTKGDSATKGNSPSLLPPAENENVTAQGSVDSKRQDKVESKSQDIGQGQSQDDTESKGQDKVEAKSHDKQAVAVKFDQFAELLKNNEVSGSKDWKKHTYLHLSVAKFEDLFHYMLKKKNQAMMSDEESSREEKDNGIMQYKSRTYANDNKDDNANVKFGNLLHLSYSDRNLTPKPKTKKIEKTGGISKSGKLQASTIAKFKKLLNLITFRHLIRDLPHGTKEYSEYVKLTKGFIDQVDELLKLLAFNRIFADEKLYKKGFLPVEEEEEEE